MRTRKSLVPFSRLLNPFKQLIILLKQDFYFNLLDVCPKNFPVHYQDIYVYKDELFNSEIKPKKIPYGLSSFVLTTFLTIKSQPYLFLSNQMHPQLPDYNPQFDEKKEKEFFQPNESRFSIHNAKTPVDQIQAVPRNSIDENICASLGNELKGICVKFSYVLLPRSQTNASSHVRNWDLWGPFLMCLIFAFFIDNSTTFMALIFAVFIGGVIVTFNIKILGGKISYFQSVSILGYCICPIFIALIVVQVLKFFQINSSILRFILIIVATVWSILAARSFIGVNLPEHKKFVGLYPIIVFYFFIAILMIFR